MRLLIVLLALAVFLSAPGPRGLMLCFCTGDACTIASASPVATAAGCCAHDDEAPLRLVGDDHDCPGLDAVLFDGMATGGAPGAAKPVMAATTLPGSAWTALTVRPRRIAREHPARAPPPQRQVLDQLASIRLLI